MSFRASALRFQHQTARHLRDLHPARIRVLDGGSPTGAAFDVALPPVRREQEITENGVAIIYRSTLRVLKSLWQPTEGAEFINLATSDEFRCRTAVGADNPAAAEIVCEVIRIRP